MSDRMSVMMPEEEVRKDLADIYIGNLNTVDTDLKLPLRGKRGSRIIWNSQETLFISHDGKVTRPTYGVGNRRIILTASAPYEGGNATRTFEATVLEQPRKAAIVKLRQVVRTVKNGEEADLPPVVIATDDKGIDTTLPVKWDAYTLPEVPGSIHVKGQVEETKLDADARIIVAEPGQDANYTADAERGRSVRQSVVYEAPAGTVRLSPGTRFWDAKERMIQYLLSVDDNQMLYNFRMAAGLDVQGAGPMTGWDAPECNLKGHTTGHYLSSLALAWSVCRIPELEDKMVYMIHSLKKCQEALEEIGCAKGFLSAYDERQFDLLEVYTRYPEIWAPYYTLDKIMSGLYDCYCLAGSEEAFTILKGMGDWVYRRLSRLSRTQLDKMWSMYIAGEFGGMISVMVRLYCETGDRRYLGAALFFRNEKLFYPMEENADTLKDMHANQHIPQAIGALEIYKAGGGERYLRIAQNFWNMVVQSHQYSIGGVGETEMFHEPGAIARYMTDKTAESCASYNLLRLTFGLFRLEPDSRKMDYYENVLYNHILSSASHREDGGTTYFMPVRPGGRKEFSTDENTCCHGTGLESRFRYIHNIYAAGENDSALYVNLYIPSTLDMDNGWKLEIKESSENPGEFFIIYTGEKCVQAKTMALRIPGWAKENWEINFCGEKFSQAVEPDGYARLKRQWKPGDQVRVRFVYEYRKLYAPDKSGFSSIAYGPYILAALNDSEAYLHSPDVNEWNCNNKISKLDQAGIGIEAEGLTWKPLADVDGEKYHIYFVE